MIILHVYDVFFFYVNVLLYHMIHNKNLDNLDNEIQLYFFHKMYNLKIKRIRIKSKKKKKSEGKSEEKVREEEKGSKVKEVKITLSKDI